MPEFAPWAKNRLLKTGTDQYSVPIFSICFDFWTQIISLSLALSKKIKRDLFFSSKAYDKRYYNVYYYLKN